jgi:hypothetical protein
MVTGYGKLRIWLVDLFPRNGFVTKVMLAEILRTVEYQNVGWPKRENLNGSQS